MSAGRLSLAVGSHLVNRVEELVGVVREALQSGVAGRGGINTITSTKSSSSTSTSSSSAGASMNSLLNSSASPPVGDVSCETLRCIAHMVQGLGAPFHDRVLSLVDLMFQHGLTAELIETLGVLVRYGDCL